MALPVLVVVFVVLHFVIKNLAGVCDVLVGFALILLILGLARLLEYGLAVNAIDRRDVLVF